ncbi:MAG: LuxR C-terminal-related transcriptional regulator, partial [Candidatus Obscuribacterales bacterium]|nr:LuxR C-terminal-related transcriptional regulator [Candidatus Obscuribacterales bacterium]
LSKIHTRLDRDHVLQSAVDTLGSILKVSSCLILRQESGNAAIVTHEYVDPDLSPLGLGGSMFIPQVIAAQMFERTTILEETGIRKHEQGKYIAGMESLFESSIRSLAGTPLNLHSLNAGALVVQSDKVRTWQRHELQLIESTANVVAIALKNAELYQEAKEQVFNLNLLSNLSRQLSTAVEQLSKGPQQSELIDESSISSQQAKVPLSARELEVLRLIASGLANREIAQRLFLTESTVELHASRIRKKLKLKSRTALVKFACDNHLV